MAVLITVGLRAGVAEQSLPATLQRAGQEAFVTEFRAAMESSSLEKIATMTKAYMTGEIPAVPSHLVPRAEAVAQSFSDLRDEALGERLALDLYKAYFLPEQADGAVMELLGELVDRFVEIVNSPEFWAQAIAEGVIGTVAVGVLEFLYGHMANRLAMRGQHMEADITRRMRRAVVKFYHHLAKENLLVATRKQIADGSGIPSDLLRAFLPLVAYHTPPCYWQLRELRDES